MSKIGVYRIERGQGPAVLLAECPNADIASVICEVLRDRDKSTKFSYFIDPTVIVEPVAKSPAKVLNSQEIKAWTQIVTGIISSFKCNLATEDMYQGVAKRAAEQADAIMAERAKRFKGDKP